MDVIIGILLFIIILALIGLVVLYFLGIVHSGQTGPTGPIGPSGNIGHTGIAGIATNTGATGPQGLSGNNTTMITFNSGGNYQNNNYQFYGTQTLNETFAQIVVNKPSKISNLIVANTGYNSNGGDTKVITLRVNGQNTPLSVTMYGFDVNKSDNINIVTVNPGDKISVLFQVSTAPVPYGGSITFSITS
jgi:hypothetical protein